MRDQGGAHPLIGGWRLLSWVSIADDGSESMPLGDAPEGLLTYTAGGTMIGIMGRPDRVPFATDDLTGGTLEEQAGAFATFIAYGGSFDVEGDTVIHHVETSLFPNWLGTTQRRRWELDATDRELTLQSPPITMGGVTRIQRLRWERIGGAQPEAESGDAYPAGP
jgi:hypothetical protein